MTIEELAVRVNEELPVDWSISVELWAGGGVVSVLDPDSKAVARWEDDIGAGVLAAIERAIAEAARYRDAHPGGRP